MRRIICLLSSLWMLLPISALAATTRNVATNCTGIPSPCYTTFSLSSGGNGPVQSVDTANDSIVVWGPGTWSQDWYTINVDNLKVVCRDRAGHNPGDPAYVLSERPIFDGGNTADPGDFGIWHNSGNINRLEVNGGEFRNTRATSFNGTSVRIQAGVTGLVWFHNMYIWDCEVGILALPTDSIKIENSVLGTTKIGGSGGASPVNHNIYINGGTNYAWVQGNYIYGSWAGNNVKSRAKRTWVLYNRLFDGGDLSRYPSFNVDTPEEGLVYVIGNVMEQDNNSNAQIRMVAYGAENTNQSSTSRHCWVFNNTIANKRVGGGLFIVGGSDAQNQDGLIQITAKNNVCYGDGSGTVVSGYGTFTASNNYTETGQGNLIKFVNPGSGDYHLTAASPKPPMDTAVANGTNDGFDCTPTLQYVYGSSATISGGTTTRTTSGTGIDIGAFEYQQGGSSGGAGGGDPCTPFMWEQR